MSELAVRSDIPIPAKRECNPRNYPFDKMKVGDSFDIPYADDAEYIRNRAKLSQATSYFQRATGNEIKFTARHLKADRLIRVWRFK